MKTIIVLDSGPLGLLMQRPGLKVVASTNPLHLARFVQADLWTNL